MTNREFVEKSEVFRESCSGAQIEPTIRQASKWRNRKGKAYRYHGSNVPFKKGVPGGTKQD